MVAREEATTLDKGADRLVMDHFRQWIGATLSEINRLYCWRDFNPECTSVESIGNISSSFVINACSKLIVQSDRHAHLASAC